MSPDDTWVSDATNNFAKSEAIRGVEQSINYALAVWGDDDMVVRKALLQCRRDLRMHLEGAAT